MTIAVLMSTYNGERYLPQQLESLANQTVADSMTVYIRDDGSQDATLDIIRQWQDKLPIRRITGENKGPAMSFWELLLNPDIRADYYAFCDQDDIWDRDKLESEIQNLGNGVHLSLCNCRFVDSRGKVLLERMYSEPPEVSVTRQFVSGICQGCAMVFTDELRNYFLNHEITCVPMHDSVVILHALGYGKVAWDNTPRFSYRLHDKNVVAKENKSLFKRLATVYRNWKNSSIHSMSTVAAELLDKPLDFTEAQRQFLTHAAAYRRSFRSKGYILFHADTTGLSASAKFSYRARVLLNLY